VAFWSSEWSTGTKWLMSIVATIVASIVTALLITTGDRVFRRLSPPPSGQHSPTREATLVIQHVGKNDPRDEHFTSGYDLASPQHQSQWRRITLMPSQDPPSWRITNPVMGAVPYQYLLSDDALNDARTKGWRITLKTRLLGVIDPDGGINANFDTGVRRYDLNIVRAFPRLPGNTQLKVRLNNYVLGPTGLGTAGPETDPIDDNRLHQYVMMYDPASALAKVYVDEKERLEVRYEGHTYYTSGHARFLFGTSGAESTFELVRFEVFK